MAVLNWEILNQLPNIRDGVFAPDGKRVVLRGMPNEASGSATAKGMTTIFRHEDKTRTRKWPTPTHKTSRKDKWYEKGFLGRPPDKTYDAP